MRSRGYFRQPVSLLRTFWAASQKVMKLPKGKTRSYISVPPFKLGLVAILSLSLSACETSSPKLAFPYMSEQAEKELHPCVKEGSELHDWLDKIAKLEEQI